MITFDFKNIFIFSKMRIDFFRQFVVDVVDIEDVDVVDVVGVVVPFFCTKFLFRIRRRHSKSVPSDLVW